MCRSSKTSIVGMSLPSILDYSVFLKMYKFMNYFTFFQTHFMIDLSKDVVHAFLERQMGKSFKEHRVDLHKH